MPKKIDIRTVDAITGKHLLMARRAKAAEYERRKAVLKARCREWQQSNPEKARAARQQWAIANPSRKATITRASYERNRDQVLARQAERDRNLNDAVVRGRFARASGLQSQDVPDGLVPVVRLSILIKRELKAAK